MLLFLSTHKSTAAIFDKSAFICLVVLSLSKDQNYTLEIHFPCHKQSNLKKIHKQQYILNIELLNVRQNAIGLGRYCLRLLLMFIILLKGNKLNN